MITCGSLSTIRGGSNAEADFDLVMDAEAAAGELSKKFAQGHVASGNLRSFLAGKGENLVNS